MPIRFRCVYCNQLLGIAHRKAGTVVRCPTCAGQVVVPTPENAGPVPHDSSPGEPFVFEQNDFDQLFAPDSAAAPGVEAPPPRSTGAAVVIPQPVALIPQPAAEAPAGAWGTYAEPPFDVERVDAARRPAAGIVLSSTKATVLGIVWIVSLVVAFGVGLLIGMLIRPASQQPEEGQVRARTASVWEG